MLMHRHMQCCSVCWRNRFEAELVKETPSIGLPNNCVENANLFSRLRTNKLLAPKKLAEVDNWKLTVLAISTHTHIDIHTPIHMYMCIKFSHECAQVCRSICRPSPSRSSQWQAASLTDYWLLSALLFLFIFIFIFIFSFCFG